MGMEIFGTNPNNPCGKYFGITAWGWHPLATYVREVAPDRRQVQALVQQRLRRAER